MKKLLFSLGLSLTVLLSMAFAQQPVQKAAMSKTQNTAFIQRGHQKHKVATLRNAIPEPTPLRFKTAYKADHNGKTMIKLEVGSSWGNGSGYQLLLDKECKIANDYGGYVLDGIEDPKKWESLYAAADFTIPANAGPEVGTTSVLDFKSDSVFIDPGTYDVLVTNPDGDFEDPTDLIIWIAGNGNPAYNGVFDDISFLADYTYVFEVFGNVYSDYVILHIPINLTASATPFYSALGTCNNEKTHVKMSITNNGSQPVSNMQAYYYVKGSEASKAEPTKITKTITETLEAGKTITVTFDEELSVPVDEPMRLVIGVDSIKDESTKTDNEFEVGLFRKSSIEIQEDSPLQFNLTEGDFACDNPSAWAIRTGEGLPETGVLLSNDIASPLISRCLELKKDDTIRLSYEHMLGASFLNFTFPSTYYVLVGKVDNADFADWDTIYELHQVYLDHFETNNIYFSVEENGTYAIAFIEDGQEGTGMGLTNISLGKLSDYDVRINSFYGMASIMPEEHVNRTMPAHVIIENVGKRAVDAIVKVTLNSNEIFTTDVNQIKINAKDTLDIDLPISGLTLGDAVLKATVSIKGHDDAIPDDNSIEKIIKVDDRVMAYDYATEEMYENQGVGLSGTNIGLGLPFTIETADTLTGISVGWAEWTDMPVVLRVYEWNAQKGELGNMLLNETVQRREEAGQREYTIPARLLKAGTYMISVQQTGQYFNLVCDDTKEGFLYITTNNPVSVQYGFGTPALRAIWGHAETLTVKDLSVTEISQPREYGSFSNEEPIVVKVVNNGHEDALDVPVTVMVNHITLPVQKIDIPAYSEAELTFKGDLAAANATFVLTAFTSLEGDEYPQNDTCTKTVHSISSVNPYIMDFESCQDFAITNELAAWQGIIGPTDAQASYSLADIDFPHAEELFSFIAFNPALTTPSCEGSLQPHGGKRFGASFSWYNAPTNAWLVSPKLKLPATNASMSFFVKSLPDDLGLPEEYNVLVSTTDNKLESFKKIGQTREAPTDGWKEVTVDLSEYAGNDVYLAIQHVSDERFVFMIDDIVVASNTANENRAANIRINAWPNPADEIVYIRADQLIEQVSIYTPAGNMLYQSANNMKAEEFRYNVKNLTSGLYIARVKTAQGTGIIKFVVR